MKVCNWFGSVNFLKNKSIQHDQGVQHVYSRQLFLCSASISNRKNNVILSSLLIYIYIYIYNFYLK
jgi:hypothetical protein